MELTEYTPKEKQRLKQFEIDAKRWADNQIKEGIFTDKDFGRLFSKKMDELAIKAGLRVSKEDLLAYKEKHDS